MRTDTRRTGVWVLLFLSVAGLGRVKAQNGGSQVLKLPDPTPRELTPELRYHQDGPSPGLPQKLTAAQNEKRWQLILWATSEMVVLSERAEKAALASPGDASKKDLEQNLIKIDSLSKNLTAALKVH